MIFPIAMQISSGRACWSYWRVGKLVGSGLLDRDEALAALKEAVWANGLRSAGIKKVSFEKGLAAAADDPVIPRREHATEQGFVPVGASSHTNNPPTTTALLEGIWDKVQVSQSWPPYWPASCFLLHG